jgi:hypothetical protein
MGHICEEKSLNENLNLLVGIKFLIFFIILKKIEKLLVRTKFYWPWAEESVLIVQTGSRPFKKLKYDVKTMIIKQSPQNFIEGDK